MNINNFIKFAKYAAEVAEKDAVQSAKYKFDPDDPHGSFANVVKNDPSQAFTFYQQNADVLNDWAKRGSPTHVIDALADSRKNPVNPKGERNGPNEAVLQRHLLNTYDNYKRLQSLVRFYNAQNNSGLNPQAAYERASAISKLLHEPEVKSPTGADNYFMVKQFDKYLNKLRELPKKYY